MKRSFRLTRSTDFKRVRRFGKSYSHPLIVLIVMQNHLGKSRFAIAAGRSLGKAVQRNRAKRLLREALRPLVSTIATGWDVVLLARRPISTSNLIEIREALIILLNQAQLMNNTNVN